MKNFLLCLLFFIVRHGNTGAQENFIPNPGFENYTACPTKMGLITKCIGWFSPNAATPDYFNECNRDSAGLGADVSVPKSYWGYRRPFSGRAFAGFIADGIFREYVSVRLKYPLTRGVKYHLSIYVALSQTSNLAVERMGFYLDWYPINQGNDRPLMNIRPQVESQPGKFFTDTAWTHIAGYFTASGGERYLTIGNFKMGQEDKIAAVVPLRKMQFPKAYYYIDNFQVEEAPDSLQNPAVLTRMKRSSDQLLNKLRSFDNIYFESGKAGIHPSSFPELDSLVLFLKKNASMNVEITGHTDSEGTREYNQKLSEERAKAVADYLVSKGIKAVRLRWKWEGEEKPLTDNRTENGRQLNRRVEFGVWGE